MLRLNEIWLAREPLDLILAEGLLEGPLGARWVEGARECAIEFRSFSKNAGFTGTRCAFTVVPNSAAIPLSVSPRRTL